MVSFSPILVHSLVFLLFSICCLAGNLELQTSVQNQKKENTKKIRTWPDGIVFYVIKGNYSAEENQKIIDAMDEIKTNSCIRFVPAMDEGLDHIQIGYTDPNSYCWSLFRTVAADYHGYHPVNLSPKNCLEKGMILHELMHILGFGHEHSRRDRDDYITIHWENIWEGYRYIFEEKNEETYNITYDYDSVLQYPALSNSINGNRSLSSKRPEGRLPLKEIPNRLSNGDIKKINTLYKCSEK